MSPEGMQNINAIRAANEIGLGRIDVRLRVGFIFYYLDLDLIETMNMVLDPIPTEGFRTRT